MLMLLAQIPLLFAQGGDPAAAPAPAAGGGDSWSFFLQVLPFLPIMVLFYVLVLRPQQQQEKKRQRMLKELKRNEQVVTSSGIYGTVVSVDEAGDRVVLKVGEDDRGIKIAFTRGSIVKILGGEKSEKPAETK